MSELRQRKGADTSAAGGSDSCAGCGAPLAADAMFCAKCGTKRGEMAKQDNDDKKGGLNKDEVMSQIEEMVKKAQAPPKPGMSMEAKKWKDKLKEDPYSLVAMHGLGVSYAQEEHWEKAANVMLRGFKRMDEFNNAETRHEYLYLLCLCSTRMKKYKQALLVLNDMKESDTTNTKEFAVLKCQVYCANGDMQNGVKSFNDGIKNEDFENASLAWAMAFPHLKLVDAYDICKAKIDALAEQQPDPEAAKNRVICLESMANLKNIAKEEVAASPQWVKFMKYGAVMYFFVIVYMFWWLEGRSLSNLKLTK